MRLGLSNATKTQSQKTILCWPHKNMPHDLLRWARYSCKFVFAIFLRLSARHQTLDIEPPLCYFARSSAYRMFPAFPTVMDLFASPPAPFGVSTQFR